MRRLTRTAVSLGLSLAMAFGCVPTQALAEAVEEVTVEQGKETGVPIELEASEDETSEDKALDKDEDLPAEEDLVEVDDPAADVPAVVEDAVDEDSDEKEDDIVLTTQSETVASGTWGTCPWEITSDGVLTIRPGTGGRFASWSEKASNVVSIRCEAEDGQKVIAPQALNGLFNCQYPYVGDQLDIPGTGGGTWESFEVVHATEMDLSGLDTSGVTNMSSAFSGCEWLASLDMSGWDTSNVTSANSMFNGCTSLTEFTVGSGYVIKSAAMVPASTASQGGWFSEKSQRWLTEDDIVSTRSGVADTYYTAGGTEQDNTISASVVEPTVHVMYSPSAYILTPSNVRVAGAQGDVTYQNVSTDSGAKELSVGATNGRVKVPAGTPAGTYNVTVEVTAWGDVGHYSGSQSVSYQIVVDKAANPIAAQAIQASLSATYSPTAATATAQNVTVTGAQGTVTFSNASVDATASVFAVNSSTGAVTVPKGTKAGTYAVTVRATAAGNANYKPGSKDVSFSIVVAKAAQDDRTDISAATVTVAGSWTYTGQDIEPTPTVTLDGATLRSGTDYTLSYAGHRNAGTATVTATGAGDYKGSATGTFQVAPAEITSVDDIADVAWTGGEAAPALVVRAGDLVLGEGDYDVSYEGDRTKVGTITVTVTAKGNFSGALSKAFNIVRAPDDPEAQGSVYQELVGMRDDAQRAADAAVEALAEKEQAYQDALAALETVQAESEAERSRLEDAVENAQAALASAEEDRDEKQQALEGANAAVAANASAIGAAEADLTAKQTTVAQKQSAVEAAQAAVDAVQDEYDNAAAAVAAAQATIDAEVPNPGTNANHEEWTALGLFRYILANTSTSDEAHWDAQCAIDILTSGTNTTGHSYKTYQGPVPDGAQASAHANISSNVNWSSRADAVSLDNFSAALGFIDEYNEYRARENREENCSLSTNVGMNCRLMAIAAVQLDVSQDIDASGGHTQAYHVGENLSWGYRDPFDGWYVKEKDDWKKGATSGVGHYMNIVDQLPKGTQNPTMGTGFAVHTGAPKYGVAHGQVFHTTSGYDVYNPSVTYTVSEFRTQWFNTYYQQQVEAGMFGTTEAQKKANRSALSDAQENQREKKTALDNAKAALAAATSERDAANAAVASAQSTLDDLRGQTAGLEAAVSTAQGDLDEAEAGVTQRQADYDAAVAANNSFDGAAQVQAAQAVVDTAVAERDAAQAASDEAAARLGEAMGAFGAATTITDQNAVVEGVSDVTYDGKAQTQPNARLLIVMRGPDGREEAYELGRGTDYDVTFSGNKNAGTATMAFS
ncbi:MAG: BspA family leucine-rich repeat surface protein, partial [Atopobiaceae bacterium]|nr:BspA family leucine-rich repeat surface protein [Atopobiaceae bacterium]